MKEPFTLLLLGFFVFAFVLQDRQTAAWVRIWPPALTNSSPSSYIRAPGGTAKVSKMSHPRLYRRCFLPQSSSGDDEDAGAAASPTQRKQKKRVPMPASSSSNDNTALAFARIVIENNYAMMRMVDDKLDKALGKWLDKEGV